MAKGHLQQDENFGVYVVKPVWQGVWVPVEVISTIFQYDSFSSQFNRREYVSVSEVRDHVIVEIGHGSLIRNECKSGTDTV